ncbi:PAS domain-containing protein [Streptomyces sp. NPDC000410]|uniref:PAS domain-containing protein n=1 Tax=Streptomyces sp. NPDC000410 TaxID=3154254 RepID=UPI003327B968
MSSRPSRGAARLAAILDALPDGLVLVNCNGTVVNANTIALEMFETPGTALVGRGLLDLLPAFDSKLIPGSMRRPEAADERGRTKPTRMIARRTDGGEFPVEVTSASLEDGREAYDSYSSYTGDELLMLVVRDLSGTLDTEAELARSQRQTEMILRAAAEGVVGTDTDGRVVLVNPAAAQILGFRASDLGGKELHPLILHSRPDGEPFPYDESPLADTLRSGRKHRVRGQVLWAKNGKQVPVDLTTAPVRDGDQLVGAVMTFTDRRPYEELAEQHAAEISERDARHAAEIAERDEKYAAREEKYTAEIADRTERYASDIEERDEREAALTARQAQLTAVLGDSLRGPLEELRGELAKLAADPAGQLWPEANQILHHLAAGYARMTTLVDNVLGFQRLDAGTEPLRKDVVLLDAVVAAGVEGAIELIGPGRAQFAVHAPPIEAEVDGGRLATALAHLVADVAGVDSTGQTRVVAAQGGGYVDSTIVVAAAQRGDVVRIEVRGPYAGGDPVHEPIVRGIVTAHGGVLQTHEVPGMSGSAYVLEVPLGEGSGTVASSLTSTSEATPAEGTTSEGTASEGAVAPSPEEKPVLPAQATSGGGRRRARRASTDAFLESPVGGTEPDASRTNGGGTGRRRGRPSPAEAAEGAVVTAAEGAAAAAGTGRPALGETVPPQGVAPEPGSAAPQPTGRRARRAQAALPALPSAPSAPAEGNEVAVRADAPARPGTELSPAAPTGVPPTAGTPPIDARAGAGAGALEPAQASTASTAPAGLPSGTGLSPVGAGATGAGLPGVPDTSGTNGTNGTGFARTAPSGVAETQGDPSHAALPARHPVGAGALEPAGAGAPTGAAGSAGAAGASAGTGGRRTRRALAGAPEQARSGAGEEVARTAFALPPAEADRGPAPRREDAGDDRHDAVRTVPDTDHTPPQAHPLPTGRRRAPQEGGTGSVPLPPAAPVAPVPPVVPGPLPAEAPTPAKGTAGGAADSADASQGKAFSVRTLGQGVPFAQQITQQQNQPLPSGRRRKLSTPPDEERAESPAPEAAARPHPQPQAQPQPQPQPAQQQRIPAPAEGRSYAIGAPDEGAEGPEPLDGPGGAVEVANQPAPVPVDDELPPEPLDNPRRLLVWPAPDVSTQQALSDRGYRPVIVHSREEVDAQIAAFPAALFVDPLTGPITRTALQSLRQAAVAAEVPVLLAAGLGQATREAAYGADPAVLLKALAPRDSEQHPSRVLLIEEHDDIALALAATLERRGMQVARAGGDTDAVTLAQQMRPNLVVMDLMQVRRRRAGIIDWLRANGQLNRTPLVVYTSAGLNQEELHKLSSGETVLFLAERSTSAEVQGRIVDLLAKIGTN